MKGSKQVKIRPISDDEEARIQAGIAADPDNPEWTEEDFARALPARDVLPPALYAALTRQRKPASPAPELKRVSLRIDPKVIERFKSTGPGWQGRINDVLREAVGLRKVR